MRINSIELYNFGSYEGEARFNTWITNKRNIILVGGKNGAGKTTLFTAMRVCLYGYISMGYKSQNSYYKRAITRTHMSRWRFNSAMAEVWTSIVYTVPGYCLTL